MPLECVAIDMHNVYRHQSPVRFAGSALRPGAQRPLADIRFRRILALAHRALLTLGLAAIAVLAVMLFNPRLTDTFKAISPFSKPSRIGLITDTAAPQRRSASSGVPIAAAPAAAAHAIDKDKLPNVDAAEQQQALTGWLSKRYRVATDAVRMLVSTSYAAADETKLDPLLILAVISVESKFNPFAEGTFGARGLMQVRFEGYPGKLRKAGSAGELFDPAANIRLGARILKDCLVLDGSLESALNRYAGDAATGNSYGYRSRIMAEYRQLQRIANRRNLLR